MKRSGCKPITCIFYGCLLTGTCTILPAAVQTSLHHLSRAPLQSAAPHTQSSLQLQLLNPAIRPISHHPHLPLHTSMPVMQPGNSPPKITYFQHRTTQRPQRHPIARRGKRQSSAASLLFPAALEGAAPPSQYPWAILWGPTVSDEDGIALSSASSTSRPGFYFEGGHHEEPARGLDLRGAPTTLRPPIYSPSDEGTDPQLYVTIVISVLIVLVATGIIVKFCCDRRQRRRRHRTERCPLPEEGSLQPLTDLSPDTDITGLQPLKLGDFKSGNEERGGPYKANKIPMGAM